MFLMPLQDLLEPLLIKRVEGRATGDVTGFAYHSDSVQPGNLFVSLAGRQTEGWRYARQAFRNKALAIIAGQDCPLEGLPVVRVPDVRLAAALLADRFYGYPSRKFRLIGVTGTNGKTSTTHMINALFRERHETTGLLGTVGYWIGAARFPAPATTPEACDLQALLARLAEIDAGRVIMEVSSHALEQHRVSGCRFAVAVLTNITGEHLDYHRSFKAYLEAKTKLFARLGWGGFDDGTVQTAVLNADDPYCRYVERWSAGQKITYGIVNRADVRAAEMEIYTAQARETGKPEQVLAKIAEGKLNKWMEQTVLLEQAFVKEPEKTIDELRRELVAKIGENIEIRRFVRFQLGEEPV